MSDRDPRDTGFPGGHADIAELIRLAGRRPAAPADEIARIKSAAHASWKEKVCRRSTRRAAWAFAGMAAAVVMLAIGVSIWRNGIPESAPVGAMARAQTIVGTVSMRAGVRGAATAMVEGAELPAGSVVTTSGDGMLAVSLPTGHSVRVDSASRVRVLSGSSLDLESGAVYVDSGSRSAGQPLAILTPAGEVRDLGTQFEVRVEGASLRIRVREGSVSLVGGHGRFEVAPGTELRVAEAGQVVRGEIPGYGPEWDWFADVTPMMDVAGRPLRDFVEWVARERGWTLRFAPGAADEASAIILSGSVDGLTLDDALAAVLETCRLTHRIENGVLTIE